MISQAVKQALQRFVPEENIKYQEPLREHTTFRVGGEADCIVEIGTQKQLQGVLHYLNLIELPYYVLGNGSNLLVGDKGYKGIILRLAGNMTEIKAEGNRLYVQAGALLSEASKAAMENGLTGLEFACGIPGTVGGGIVMNAGAYDGEIKNVVESVTVIDRDGNELELDNSTMEFGYRSSVIKNQPFVATGCWFKLEPGEKEAIRAKMEDFNARRSQKQPLEYPSAGSTFKRPQGYYAGKLIMDAGLCGYRIGGAQVSEKHCGFVINAGDATAADIRQLITHVQDEVYDKFNVRLEPEVICLGQF